MVHAADLSPGIRFYLDVQGLHESFMHFTLRVPAQPCTLTLDKILNLQNGVNYATLQGLFRVPHEKL